MFADPKLASKILANPTKHGKLDLIISECGQPSYNKSLVDGFKFYISGLLTAFTGICGTVGNILSIGTLLHRLDAVFSNTSL